MSLPSSSAGEGPQGLSAVTLLCSDMARSIAFYEALGLRRSFGEAGGWFCSFRMADGRALNLMLPAPGVGRESVLDAVPAQRGWGRLIFRVDGVDDLHTRLVARGLQPETAPSDAPWGERFFHLSDPDGHPLAFAAPLRETTEGSPAGREAP